MLLVSIAHVRGIRLFGLSGQRFAAMVTGGDWTLCASVYDGGALSDAEVKEIVLADGELAVVAFVPGDEVAGLVTPLLARRVASCLDAMAGGAVAALENGSPAA